MSKCSVIEVLVGIFVSAAVVTIGGFMFSRLSQSTKFYSRCDTTIKAFFADVDGLKVGNDVRVSGVKVGAVSALQLDDDNVPVVAMCLQKGVRLPVDSAAAINYADLMGRKHIDIIPGADSDIMHEGAFLAHTSTAPSFKTILGKIVNTALK